MNKTVPLTFRSSSSRLPTFIMPKTSSIQEVLGSNCSLHALSFSTSLACISASWNVTACHTNTTSTKKECKTYYRTLYINGSLISDTNSQMCYMEQEITLSCLPHPDLKYWRKGVISILITHIYLPCKMKHFYSIQGNIAEKTGLSLAQPYFSPLSNEAVHIILHRFKLTWNRTRAAMALAHALSFCLYCKQEYPARQTARNSL